MVRVRSADNRGVSAVRQRELSHARRVACRGDVADIQRQGQPRRAGADNHFQRAVRDNLIQFRVLRRDDNLPRNDRADVGFRADIV